MTRRHLPSRIGRAPGFENVRPAFIRPVQCTGIDGPLTSNPSCRVGRPSEQKPGTKLPNHFGKRGRTAGRALGRPLRNPRGTGRTQSPNVRFYKSLNTYVRLWQSLVRPLTVTAAGTTGSRGGHMFASARDASRPTSPLLGCGFRPMAEAWELMPSSGIGVRRSSDSPNGMALAR